MPKHATVRVDKFLNLEVTSVDGDAGGPTTITVKAQLTRIGAQQLSDALAEYAGLVARSYDRGDRTVVPAVDHTLRPKTIRPSVVRVTPKAARNPVVRLGTSKPKR